MPILDSFKSLFASSSAKKGRSRRVNVRERFELLREAVSGTMSKFYMAKDRESDKIVGLKILDKKKNDAFEERFKGLKKPREGVIATSFSHPNIVETFEHGQTTNDEYFLVMEFVDGPGLNSLLYSEQNKILNGQRVIAIRHIAEALKAVHEAGYIHRDICPRNIMLDKASGKVKLIDFGLTLPAKPEFMQEGNRTGNPNYMAPEIIRRKKTSPRVDVFAFGVTAYEICTSELPWSRGLTGAAAMDHATKLPTDIRKVKPDIHPKLASAIHWCLQQDVKERCPDMEAFLLKVRSLTSDIAKK
ncbi:MAG: serine/threonine protein kinase [Pirellulales bacterium]|nr:serine/threonine protein kinase [Pirellulales bacterium]